MATTTDEKKVKADGRRLSGESSTSSIQHPASFQEQIAQERAEAKANSNIFGKLGMLPQWKIGGKHMSGTPLNYAIGIIASTGFLMFGCVRSRRVVSHH